MKNKSLNLRHRISEALSFLPYLWGARQQIGSHESGAGAGSLLAFDPQILERELTRVKIYQISGEHFHLLFFQIQ